ncbi:MAG: hypothetical protein CL940_00185 [Deltaproteobacteria bacterium]|nr:hypothetical protein [Deltaproteobacteria bacterium]
MSVRDPQKLEAQRVEPVSFQSVEGVSVRPWLPEQAVDVTSWKFDGAVYGEPVDTAEPSAPEPVQPVVTGPTVEALQAELESKQEASEAARQDHERALAEVREAYDTAARRFETSVLALDNRISESAVSLAVLMAERLLAREAGVDPTVLMDNLNRALDRVGPVEHLRIEAHADDVDRLRTVAPDLAKERTGRAIDIIVTASDRLTRGGLVISFDRGVIDASWGSQLGHLGEAVALAFDAERLEADADPALEASEPASAQPVDADAQTATVDQDSPTNEGEDA